MRTWRTLIAGVLAPFLAAGLGLATYMTLTRASGDPDRDFVFRLSLTTLAMTLPFWTTLLLARADRRRAAFGKASGWGLFLACASLSLAWLPVRGMVGRSRQAKALALAGVPAPLFETVDIHGEARKLSDHEGQVVLINVWATWCGPCRAEMPKLDRLFRKHQAAGLMVLGLSSEDPPLQQSFAKEVPVSYPLLTVEGSVPELYRNVVRYPANFLVDRTGRLQPAPSADQPFETLTARVEELLRAGH
jgi:peroxiredoxin